MKVERNISYLEGHYLPYHVHISRNHQFINESFDTLEEAVMARDEIRSNYLKTGKLDHSSIYEPGNLKLAQRRYRSKDLKKTTSSGQAVYAIETVCKRCNRKLIYRWHGYYQRFLDRDQLCQSCHKREHYDEFLDTRNANGEPNSNNQSTGIKNITFDRTYSRYRVTVDRQKIRLSRYADSLEEAIAIKERILDFYERFDRLPTSKEI